MRLVREEQPVRINKANTINRTKLFTAPVCLKPGKRKDEIERARRFGKGLAECRSPRQHAFGGQQRTNGKKHACLRAAVHAYLGRWSNCSS